MVNIRQKAVRKLARGGAEERAHHEAIIAAGPDREPSLRYAEFLEEHGSPALAQLIRLHFACLDERKYKLDSAAWLPSLDDRGFMRPPRPRLHLYFPTAHGYGEEPPGYGYLNASLPVLGPNKYKFRLMYGAFVDNPHSAVLARQLLAEGLQPTPRQKPSFDYLDKIEKPEHYRRRKLARGGAEEESYFNSLWESRSVDALNRYADFFEEHGLPTHAMIMRGHAARSDFAGPKKFLESHRSGFRHQTTDEYSNLADMSLGRMSGQGTAFVSINIKHPNGSNALAFHARLPHDEAVKALLGLEAEGRTLTKRAAGFVRPKRRRKLARGGAEEAAHHANILENGYMNNGPAQRYADFLEEHGLPAHAFMIRSFPHEKWNNKSGHFDGMSHLPDKKATYSGAYLDELTNGWFVRLAIPALVPRSEGAHLTYVAEFPDKNTALKVHSDLLSEGALDAQKHRRRHDRRKLARGGAEERGFHADLSREPWSQDVGNRYAEWLEEHGLAGHAALLRAVFDPKQNDYFDTDPRWYGKIHKRPLVYWNQDDPRIRSVGLILPDLSSRNHEMAFELTSTDPQRHPHLRQMFEQIAKEGVDVDDGIEPPPNQNRMQRRRRKLARGGAEEAAHHDAIEAAVAHGMPAMREPLDRYADFLEEHGLPGHAEVVRRSFNTAMSHYRWHTEEKKSTLYPAGHKQFRLVVPHAGNGYYGTIHFYFSPLDNDDYVRLRDSLVAEGANHRFVAKKLQRRYAQQPIAAPISGPPPAPQPPIPRRIVADPVALAARLVRRGPVTLTYSRLTHPQPPQQLGQYLYLTDPAGRVATILQTIGVAVHGDRWHISYEPQGQRHPQALQQAYWAGYNGVRKLRRRRMARGGAEEQTHHAAMQDTTKPDAALRYADFLEEHGMPTHAQVIRDHVYRVAGDLRSIPDDENLLNQAGGHLAHSYYAKHRTYYDSLDGDYHQVGVEIPDTSDTNKKNTFNFFHEYPTDQARSMLLALEQEGAQRDSYSSGFLSGEYKLARRR